MDERQATGDEPLHFDETVPPSPRPAVPAVDAILGRPIRVLDHGFVRLVDYMGDDAAIVQAARVSYGPGTRKVSEDKALIRYLLRNLHTSPFEMVEVKLHVKAPIFVARQWLRHRTAAANEMSGRYSILPEEMYLPDNTQISFQSADNKQGRSADPVDPALRARVRDLLLAGQREAYAGYQELLDAAIARELARIALPVSIYTEWYWKINLHNLFHFLELRTDAHAQYEIRVYAEAICLIAQRLAPVAYEAFEDYIRQAVRLSRVERGLVARALRGEPLRAEDWKGLGKRERAEFARKFGLTPEELFGGPAAPAAGAANGRGGSGA
ncbi:MAG TPA: FAD-dependent thymidylate synthase [Thermomicrobiales bacterium]|nr:FAD-dependent thymidylate synthase [Thermomicrobiales bacterium]